MGLKTKLLVMFQIHDWTTKSGNCGAWWYGLGSRPSKGMVNCSPISLNENAPSPDPHTHLQVPIVYLPFTHLGLQVAWQTFADSGNDAGGGGKSHPSHSALALVHIIPLPCRCFLWLNYILESNHGFPNIMCRLFLSPIGCSGIFLWVNKQRIWLQVVDIKEISRKGIEGCVLTDSMSRKRYRSMPPAKLLHNL